MATDEEIRLRMTIDARNALNSVNEFSASVKKAQDDLIKYSAQSGKSLEVTARGLKQAYKETEMARAKITSVGLGGAERAEVFKQARENITKYNQAMGVALSQTKEQFARTEGSAKSLVGSLGVLGNVGKFVFGSILGITAISVLRSLVDGLREAAVAGYEFSKSLFQLSAGVNAIRRSGVDITFKDVMTNIKALKKEFPIFSIPELVAGTSALINLTRAFGFTKEQIFELQDTIVKLAIINGRAMDDVQRTIALAISSGYTEGLQRLGVSINRINIAEKAAALGYADSYMALTELERAEATRLLILEKTALYQDDLTAYQKQLPGLIDASTASFKDLSAQLGMGLLPIWALFMRALQHATNFFTRVLGEVVPNVLKSLVNNFMILAGVAQQTWEIVSGKRVAFDMNAINKKAKEVSDLVKGYFAGEAFVLPEPEIPKAGIKEFTDEQLDAYESLFRDLMDLQEEYNSKYKEAQVDYLTDLAKIDKEYLDRRKEIWQNYYDEVAKINADAADEVAEANKDLSQDIEDLNRDTQNSIQDANKKYHENEIKAERDYQEKLRRLREEFLFDLEDALRERDALQVLRLIRRYQLDKQQTERGYEQEKQERQEAYKSELEDIRKQAAEKLRELQIEHQRRLQEIEAQRQKELAEAQQKRDEELAVNREEWLAKREERTKQYATDLEELKTWLNDSLTEIATKFLEMNGVTAEMSKMLGTTIKSVFGTSGLADIYFGQFNAMLDNAILNAQAKIATLNSLLASVNAMSNSVLTGGTPTINPQGTYVAPGQLNPTPGTVWTGGHASGATNMIVTRPKSIMVGEVPEKVDVTPLNQLGSKGNGKGILEILLGAGLEGRMVDNALEQVEIVFRKELERK